MASPASRSRACSALYQLLSMAFSHPIAPLSAQMADGRFQDAYDAHLATVFGRRAGLPRLASSPAAFEASYIELFETGAGGRPAVPMCAGEYEAILAGRARPTVLLQYVQFYRNFGLKVRSRGEDNELPDHLTCQLELMAWLRHLEALAHERNRDVAGYRDAQRDFIERLAGPFVTLFVKRLASEAAHRGADPLLISLGTALADLLERHRHELGAALPPPSRPERQPEPVTSTQNLWG
jgi:DMSO reductase family type II enzyme chaperone